MMPVSQAMKEGAEADSLNNPFYYKADSFSAFVLHLPKEQPNPKKAFFRPTTVFSERV